LAASFLRSGYRGRRFALFYANLSYEWLGPTIFISAGGAFLMLYLHDRRQAAALRISAAYFCSLIGYATVMMVGGELRPSYQALILFSVSVR
jgi:hypothetical protein